MTGSGSVIYTNDGGNSWTVIANISKLKGMELEQEEGEEPSQYENFDIHFSDSKNGWIIASAMTAMGSPVSIILHTADGGKPGPYKEGKE